MYSIISRYSCFTRYFINLVLSFYKNVFPQISHNVTFLTFFSLHDIFVFNLSSHDASVGKKCHVWVWAHTNQSPAFVLMLKESDVPLMNLTFSTESLLKNYRFIT